MSPIGLQIQNEKNKKSQLYAKPDPNTTYVLSPRYISSLFLKQTQFIYVDNLVLVRICSILF